MVTRAVFVLTALVAASCATVGRRGPSIELPAQLFAPVGRDSAHSLILAAMTVEKLPVDGSPGGTSPAGASTTPGLSGAQTVQSTFVVRKGGLGEAEIVISLRLLPSAGSGSGGDSVETVVTIDGTAREKQRMLIMSQEEARQATMRRAPHPIAEDDVEVRARVHRLIERLQALGFTSAAR